MLQDLDAAEFAVFSEFVYELLGIRYTEGKISLLSNRIRRRMRDLGIEDYGRYLALLRDPRRKDELQRFIDEVTTNETHFFRCERHWDWFREWAREKTAAGQASLRIWSAACSTGAEAGTALIVLRELLGPDFSKVAVELVATDVSRSALERAAAGRYPPYVLAQVPPALRRRYFRQDGDELIFDESLRRRIRFGRHNLLDPMPGPPFDLVFLRNVLIYFDRESKSRALSHVLAALKPAGILVLGESESLIGTTTGLDYLAPAIFRRQQNPVAAAAPRQPRIP
ncbi:MAG: chemotaxis protein CheR [Planctomycetota bacterium]